MPVNYQQVQQQVREQVKLAPALKEQLRERLQKARDLLSTHSNDLEYLQNKVKYAASHDKGLRCAVPLTEPLNLAASADAPAVYPLLLAADGSQINPNRHDAIEFGLINIGVIRITPVQAVTPSEINCLRVVFIPESSR